MDNPRPFGTDESGVADMEGDAAIDAPPEIGTDERRMHVRAYNHWASLLRDRAYPSIEDLDPASISDFGPNSVLLDFTGGVNNPSIAWLGGALRAECDIEDGIETIDDVPPRSLLSRLTDHYMQIIANQAPVGFEAEFENHRDVNTLYRGILMPFSSDDDTIDFIYGVINWKEVASAAVQAELQQAVDRSLAANLPASEESAPVWADGPSNGFATDPDVDDVPVRDDGGLAAFEDSVAEPESVADHLVAARESAEQAKSADQRSRAVLYEALGRAYDFALSAEAEPDDYQEILDDAGITGQDRAPMTPIVKLVFGVDYDKTRLTEFAAALSHAKREHIAAGTFADYLKAQKGGLKAVVAAERAARRPAAKPDRLEAAREELRNAPAQAYVELETDAGDGEEFALLMARRLPDGRLAVIGAVPHDKALTERAIRKTAG
ncbi:MAG: PAS domain-containing protein [Parasphingopyxis sp.]|uniref:PAS domain-containing protein n=1 Tax=Parasphingopyxis sp. TaxID=1920299 RepID=UPI003FA027AB